MQLANLNGDLVYQFDESNQPIPFTAERYKVATGFTKP